MGRIFSKGALNSSSSKDNPINFSTLGVGAHSAAIRRRISRNVYTTNRGVNFVDGAPTFGIQASVTSTHVAVLTTATTAQIQVNVDRPPDNTTKLLFHSGDTNQITTDVSEMLFTTNVAQTLTININDAVPIDTYIDIEVLYGPTLRVYVEDINVSIDLTPPTVTSLSEGTTTTFLVNLDAKPEKGTEQINITSQDPERFTVNPQILIFNDQDWNQNQTVTVTAVQDFYDRPNATVGFDLVAQGISEEYGGKTATFSLEHINIDVAGISVTPPSSYSITEGQSVTMDVTLDTKPTQATNVDFQSADMNKFTVTPSITFDDNTWNIPQQITVTAVEDNMVTGNTDVVISYNVNGGAQEYDSIASTELTFTHVDNDTAGIQIQNVSSNTVIEREEGEEGEASQTFEVILTSKPTSDLTLSITGDSKLGITPATITFNNVDLWNVAQTVNVTALPQGGYTADENLVVTVQPSGTVPTEYTGLSATETFTYDAIPRIFTSSSSLSFASGTQETFDIKLNGNPGQDNTVTLTVDNVDINPNPKTFTFTTGDFDTLQTVTVDCAVAATGTITLTATDTTTTVSVTVA
jgi:hypothetical protein